MGPWSLASLTHLAMSYGNISEIVLRSIPAAAGFFLGHKIILVLKFYHEQGKASKTSSISDVFYFSGGFNSPKALLVHFCLVV